MLCLESTSSHLLVTARKRSLRRLCFHPCLSVILFTGGVRGSGGCVWQEGGVHDRGRGRCAWQGGMHGSGGHGWQGGVHGRGACAAGGHAWQGACVVGGMHGRGHTWQGGACMAGGMHGGGHAWQGVCMAHMPPPKHYEIQSVNVRVVRILLECILVFKEENRFRHSETLGT